MKIIEINPPIQKTYQSKYKNALIIAKKYIDTAHSLGFIGANIGNFLCSTTEELNLHKANQ